MARESVLGVKAPFEGKYTPELVTPEMTRVLGMWRFWTVGDGGPYFSVLDTIMRLAEDRGATISSMLANPDLNFDGKLLDTAEPMTARHNEVQGYRGAITDATGIGLYLTGQEHPEFPTSWVDIAKPRGGRVGRAAIKAMQTFNRKTRQSLETIDKEYGADIHKLFTATTSVAWQYVDAFEADTVSLMLVRMSGLPKDAKRDLRVYKNFRRWGRRFEATTQEPNPDKRLQMRREIFKEVVDSARTMTTRRTLYSRSAAMTRLAEVVQDYGAFSETNDSVIADLAQVVNLYEASKY